MEEAQNMAGCETAEERGGRQKFSNCPYDWLGDWYWEVLDLEG